MAKDGNRNLWIILLSGIWAVSASGVTPSGLSEIERDHLRFQLEEHFNQLDLIIRNQGTDRRDLERLEREMAMFRVFERIPLEEKIPNLTQELRSYTRKSGLVLRSLRVVSRKTPPREPAMRWSDSTFRIRPENTVSELYLEARLEGGDGSQMRAWVQGLKDGVIRVVEARGAPRWVHNRTWTVPLSAYRFVAVSAAKFRLRAPRTLLPTWARENTEKFAKFEPILWSFVSRAEALAPEAAPLFENRRKFMLSTARMTLFMRKTLRKSR
jgi:hypothetical protein